MFGWFKKNAKEPGRVRMPYREDPYFYYVDQNGEWRQLHLWVEGVYLCIGNTDLKQTYSLEGVKQEPGIK